MGIQFLYNNFLDTSTTLITSTSQETVYPDDNIIVTDRNKPWRTPTSGGYFVISAGSRWLDFRSANGSLNAASMSISAYSFGSLRNEIITQMNAVSAVATYTVVTANSFGSDFRWWIAQSIGGAGSLTFLGNNGANAANNINSLLGYITSSNESTTTGTLTALNRSIHSYEFIQFDFGAARTISAIGIVDRLSDGIQIQTSVNSGTARFQGSDTEAFTSLTTDLTLTIQSGQYIAKPTGGSGTLPAARYWRVLISDPRNSNGYVQLGYASFGQPFEPTSTDVSVDWQLTHSDPSPIQKALGGQSYFDKIDKFRKTSISLPLMSNADHDSLFSIFSITGISEPFFLFLDPTLSVSANLGELSIYGRFREELSFQYQISDLYSLNFEFEEAL